MQFQIQHRMIGRVAAATVAGCVLASQLAVAQAPFQYREYALDTSVASVAALGETRAELAKTIHTRPALIQELEWRAPYVRTGSDRADPVRDILFSFYNDRLYEILITYDRGRMEGLTNTDVIDSVSATYGQPLLRSAKVMPGLLLTEMPLDTTVVAQWENETSLLSLRRGVYSPQFQLVLISKPLHTLARAAIKDAMRLDVQEAPQRLLEQQKKNVADGVVATDKARVVNKAAFRP
jgi:hypothetical protein